MPGCLARAVGIDPNKKHKGSGGRGPGKMCKIGQKGIFWACRMRLSPPILILIHERISGRVGVGQFPGGGGEDVRRLEARVT